MRRVIRRPYFDFENEEKFINKMSAEGWALTKYTWCKYTFEDAPKGQYVFRIELLEKPINHPQSRDYIRFMEETGAKLITSYNCWAYFRRDTADGEFNIYSDIESKLKHYKRIRNFFLPVTVLELFVGISRSPWSYTGRSAEAGSLSSYLCIFASALGLYLAFFVLLPLIRKINRLERERSIRG